MQHGAVRSQRAPDDLDPAFFALACHLRRRTLDVLKRESGCSVNRLCEELSAGMPMRMRTCTGRHVIVDGQVEVFEPPHHFVHTHRLTQFDDPVCRVCHELRRVGDGGVGTHN